MSDQIRLLALGGLDEEGRDCYVLEINNDIFVLDFGSSLPDKTIPGVDSLLPNYDYLLKNKKRIKAYIITHGHDEVMAGLKYCYEFAPAPVYCTFATSVYLKSQAILKNIKVTFDFKIVEPTSEHDIGGHEVRFFQTCHNMASAFGVAIWTDRGYIVYTSDFIVDYTIKDKNFLFDIRALSDIAEKPTFLLMCESKCADMDGYCAPHHRVYSRIERYFQEDKRIFLSCFWENVFRISEYFELIKLYNKKVFLYNLYTEKVVQMMINAKTLNVTNDIFVSSDDLLRVRKEDVVVLMLGHGDDIFNEMNALAMGRNDDKRIVLNNDDVFIVGSIPTATFEVLATKSIDSLYRTGCEVVWLKRKEVPAMHARQDDLKFFLALLKPKYYFPVRGSYTNMIENAKLALSMGIGLTHMSVFILDNGMELLFDEKPRPTIIPNEVNQINIAPVLVDGTGISHVGDEVIEDRKKLGIDGVVMIASTVSLSKKSVIAGPDCQMRGFVYVKEAEPVLKMVTNIYLEEVNKALMEGVTDFAPVEAIINDRARKFIKRENGREPLVIASIIAVE